jgi:hypothetical protein
MAALTGAVNAASSPPTTSLASRRWSTSAAGTERCSPAFLRATPGLRGTVFEIPPVVEGAREHIAAAGLADAATVVGGDAFAAIPAGADAYSFKSILRLGRRVSTTLLTNCRAAIGAGGTCSSSNESYPSTPRPPPARRRSWRTDMLLLTGGRERTEAEFRSPFAAAGFRWSASSDRNPQHHRGSAGLGSNRLAGAAMRRHDPAGVSHERRGDPTTNGNSADAAPPVARVSQTAPIMMITRPAAASGVSPGRMPVRPGSTGRARPALRLRR